MSILRTLGSELTILGWCPLQQLRSALNPSLSEVLPPGHVNRVFLEKVGSDAYRPRKTWVKKILDYAEFSDD